MLKQGWVQFVCIYFILHWALGWFEHQVFTHCIVETRLISDIQPKQQRF